MTTVISDEQRTEAFVGRALGDLSATTTIVLALLGDRLGLWKELAHTGPHTSDTLAKAAGIDERYAREWLAAMAAAGYVDHEPAAGQFSLPAAHQPVLAEEAGPMFFGGFLQEMGGMLRMLDELTEAFRHGGGVHQSSYADDLWEGLSRATASWFEHLLIPVWLAEMPDARAELERGAHVADIGCGRGRAVITLARAFPQSTFVGYDIFEPTIAVASANAAAAGVDDRVRFEHLDATAGLPETFDLITTFDVVHDAARPAELLRAICKALRPDGIYLCVDINAAPDVDGNRGPLGALFYGFSVLYCMTTSLAQGGAGLGTCGFHEGAVETMCHDAGFTRVRKLPVENPFNNVYEIRR
jgi:2-polyprenyl-3-methyl-5-hydroxy-6-metoxy-1,4-benzoquinol methylase